MFNKVGQTIKKTKSVISKIGRTIKDEFSANQQKMKNNSEGPIGGLKEDVEEELNVGEGELSTATIIAKAKKRQIVKRVKDELKQERKTESIDQVNQVVGKIGNGSPDETKGVIVKLEATDDALVQVKHKSILDFEYVNEQIEQLGEINEKELEKKAKEIQEELTQALEQWKRAKDAYNYALGAEQVEYCIYQMMAAEQKYRMILLKAKKLEFNWSSVKGDLV